MDLSSESFRTSFSSAPAWLLAGAALLALALQSFHVRTAAAASPGPSALSAGPPAAASSPRTIAVSGTAEIKSAPDEFTITASVLSFDADLSAAKKENDRRVRAVMELLGEYKLDASNFQTDEFNIQPRYEGPHETRRLTGYDVRKRVVITACVLGKLEGLLADVFRKGANQLDGVSFQSTRAAELRKQARLSAVQAAREKAQAMAAELGQKLGRALRVEEGIDAGYGHGRPQVNNYSTGNESPAALGETMATGKVRVASSVSVTFELVD